MSDGSDVDEVLQLIRLPLPHTLSSLHLWSSLRV